MSTTQTSQVEWRWLALIAVLANVTINFLPDYLLPGVSVATVSHHFNTLITPANYAFTIWGLIYFAMVMYAVYQVLPSQWAVELHDHLARPLFYTNLFAMGWLISFRMEWIGLSFLIIIGMLISALQLYVRVRDFVLRDDYSNWLSVPFSLYAAWLCVATVLDASVWFVSFDLQESSAALVAASVVIILSISFLGIFVGYRCGDFIFPLVIAWACVAICIDQESNYPAVAATALVGALMPVVWMVTTWLKRLSYHHRVRANKFSF